MSKILIVHPNSMVCESVKSILAEGDHKVTFAQNGEKALEVFKSEKPEFAIVNEVLSKMSSFALYGELRKIDPKAKVLVMAIGGGDDKQGDGPRFGIRTFKPEELLQVVDALRDTSSGAIVLPNKEKSRIVAIDDNPQIREMIEDILVEEGYDVGVAKDGMDGLGLVRKMKPHLVLLDIDMPGMNGVETLRHIRSFDPKVGVVMITGNDTVEMMELCRTYGAFDYLTKPFDINYLQFLVYSKILLSTL